MRLLSLCLVFLMAFSISEPVFSGTAAVRLGLLVNLSRFTTWPNSGHSNNAPMNICIGNGDATIIREMTILEKHVVHGRKLKVMVIDAPSEMLDCDVLYLPNDFQGLIGPFLEVAQQSGTLTVSDQPDFVDNGGMVGLVFSGGRYVFDINLGATSRAGLRISSNLLLLARSVKNSN